MKPVVVGVSGASGSVIAERVVEALLAREIPTALVCTNAAKMVWQEEMPESFGEYLSAWRESPFFTSYGINEMSAPIASGTYPTSGMVIVPCSMASVASLANGMANNLLLRAADVCLKERRKLVIVPRETPLHAIHLENMARLARMGVQVMPPEPPFYLKPKGIDEVVDYFVERILVSLDVEPGLSERHVYRGVRTGKRVTDDGGASGFRLSPE